MSTEYRKTVELTFGGQVQGLAPMGILAGLGELCAWGRSAVPLHSTLVFKEAAPVT